MIEVGGDGTHTNHKYASLVTLPGPPDHLRKIVFSYTGPQLVDNLYFMKFNGNKPATSAQSCMGCKPG